MVSGYKFKVQGSRFKVQGSMFWVLACAFEVQKVATSFMRMGLFGFLLQFIAMFCDGLLNIADL
jgi:hypothetical protein